LAYDVNLQLQASTTQTATFNSTGVDLKTGTPRRGLVARLLVTAASGTTPTLDLQVQQSADNSTWYNCAAIPTQSAAGESFCTFETSMRYVRAKATIGGTTPSFTYQVDVSVSRP
jgi:hypothetical protein